MLTQDRARSTAALNVADRPPDPPRAQPANGSADREFVVAYILTTLGTLTAWGVVLGGAGALLAG